MNSLKGVASIMLGALLVLASCQKSDEIETTSSKGELKSASEHLITVSVDTLDFGYFEIGSKKVVEKDITVTNISDDRIKGFYTKLKMAGLTKSVAIGAPLAVGESTVATVKYRPSTTRAKVITGELIINANLEDEYVIPTIARVGEPTEE